jgi:DNA-binding transcriptional ArsR family regulator
MTTIAGDELLNVLLSRRAIVARLTGDPHTKPELVAECDVSRSTIDRGISALERAGIVRRGERGQYELTLFGEVTVREFERSLAHMDTLASVSDLISDIASEAGVDATLFEEATIHHSAGITITTVLKVFTDATEVCIVDPPLSLFLTGLSSDSEVFIDGEVTALVRCDMLTELAAFNPQTVETNLGGGIDIYEIGESLPFSFALVDRPTGRSLCLILGDERKGMAVVETDTDAAIDWGTKLYEQVLKNAHSVPTGELKAVLD